MILLPTRKRPAMALRFMELAPGPGTVIVDDDDLVPTRPAGWKTLRCPSFGGGVARVLDYALNNLKPQDHYVIAGDDLLPGEGWADKLRAACGPWEITYGPDGLQNERLPTHPCIGGKLARAVGSLALPNARHFYGDNMWMDIGRELGVLKYLPDAHAVHNIPGRSGIRDETWQRRGRAYQDLAIYERWRRDDLPVVLERVRMEMAE